MFRDQFICLNAGSHKKPGLFAKAYIRPYCIKLITGVNEEDRPEVKSELTVEHSTEVICYLLVKETPEEIFDILEKWESSQGYLSGSVPMGVGQTGPVFDDLPEANAETSNS